MRSETNEQVVRSYFDIWNSGNGENADRILDPKFIDYSHQDVQGIEEFRETLRATKAKFPDFNIEVVSIASDDAAVFVYGKITRTVGSDRKVSEALWLFSLQQGKIVTWKTGPIS